jgi:hypothetical protein
MEENKDYEIKVDGEYHEFEGGGIRYTKTGKGRFDLIPFEVLDKVIDKINDYIKTTDCREFSNVDTLLSFCNRDFHLTIFGIVCEHYRVKTCDGLVNAREFSEGFSQMLLDLAIHFEKGAAKYGENNWKKGIPSSSFEDSGFRHLCQWMSGKTDEPHHISAIWNMICWYWVNDNLS